MLARTAVLPSEAHSLAGLKQIRVQVDGNPILSKLVPYNTERAKTEIERMLMDADMDISQDKEVPTLRILIALSTNVKYPDMVGFTYQLSIEQNVLIERLKKRIHVPTYTLLYGTLTTEEDLLKELDRLLPTVMDYFIRRVRAADETI